MHKLLIATNNKGKVEELQDLLKDTGIELVTPAQIGLELDVIEDGHTYAENATKKGIAFANASELISLADDSGLEVDALDGAPGLYSARYGSHLTPPSFSPKMGGASGGGSDKDRRLHLLQNLKDKPRPWRARFHATIAIAIPSNVTLSRSPEHSEGAAKGLKSHDENIYIAEGICEGEIIPEERGTGGFGYDPIFLLPELGKTMAELSMDEKNRLSHRARAVMNAKGILKTLFSN
jgi:XTP/dITP diphosphohydrolase